MTNPNESKATVILGGAGKTGRRVGQRLAARQLPFRMASRSTPMPFDWDDENTWEAALAGAGALYITYFPDLALPSAAAHIGRLTRLAAEQGGVRRVVLLAGRGEPQVHPAEEAVRESGIDHTILECAFFSQNFDEGVVVPVDDTIVFPAAEVAEPFIDCEDIADVAFAALTDPRHANLTYELTGPRVLTFAEAAAAMAAASGRPLRYLPVSFEAYAEILAPHMPSDHVEFLIELFRSILDGHNSHTTDDVRRALGREARDFNDYARAAAAAGAWA